MRRAPARPVRACFVRNWCLVSHVTFEAPLRTSHLTVFTLHTTHFTLHSSHCTLRTSHSTLFTLHTALFALHTSHCTLHSPHFTLHSSHSKHHTSQSTLHISQSTLHTSHCFLHTPNFTLHSSRPTLHTALFTPHTSSHLSSSHVIPAELFSSHLFSYAALMQTLQYYLRDPAAKDNSITHAAAARSNLDAAIPMRSATGDSKTPYNYAHTSRPKAASSHHYTAARKKGKPTAAATAAQTRYLSSPAAATLHGKNARFRASASSRKHSPCNIMQPLQCDLKAQIPKHPITTHAQAHPKQLEATVTMRQKKANRPQPQPPHRRATFHRRLQPLYTEKHKVSCSGFLPIT